MTIEWFGNTCIRLSTGEATLVIDPYDASTGLRPPRLTADMALSTSNETKLSDIGGNPFLIASPGEYEIKHVFVYGIPVNNDQHESRTLYMIESEGVSLAHLGNLGHQLSNEELERLEGVDILMLPVGGHGVLDAEAASKVISSIEPRVAIPMQYKLPGLKKQYDPVNVFAKELGVKESQTVSKYKISRKDLPPEQMQVVIVQS